MANFHEVLRLAPPTWNLVTYEDCLANAYLELGRADEAIAEYARILQLNPNYPLAHFRIAQALEQKGMTDEARGFYRKFLEVWSEADADISEVIIAKNKLNSI
jgi:tetratricopeptide (TPR) repeat protein